MSCCWCGAGNGSRRRGIAGDLSHSLIVSRTKLIREKFFDYRTSALSAGTGVVNNTGLDLDLLVVVVDDKGIAVLRRHVSVSS